MKKKEVSLVITLILTISFMGMDTASAAEISVGTGKDYSTIQGAIDNVTTHDDDIITVYDGTYFEDVLVNKRLTIQTNGSNVELMPSITGFTVINNTTGDASGTQIQGFKITNTPMGVGVNVTANNCKIVKNQISGGSTGIMVTGNNTIIQGNNLSNVLNNSIQVGKTFIVNSSGNVSLVSEVPFNCRVDNNSISGGMSGISAACHNITLMGNMITGTSSRGIEIFGIYPQIFDNKIMDMMGAGSKIGISLATLNLNGTTGLKLSGNTLSNIISTNDTTMGVDIFAMTLNSTLDDLLLVGNTFSNIYGMGKTTAISLVGLALGGDISSMKIMENSISNVTSQGNKSISTGISFVALALDDTQNKTNYSQNLTVGKNNITQISSQGGNSTATAISYFALSKGNESISENNISFINTELMGIGISACSVNTIFNGSSNSSGNESSLTLNKNMISEITAINITSGIQSVVLGEADILQNSIFNLNSIKTKYIAAKSITGADRTIIKGNNLEGNGSGEGIAVTGNNTIINYNRIVNFQYFIQNINYTEFSEISKGPFLTDDEYKEYIRSQYQYLNLTDEQIDDLINKTHQYRDYEDSIPSNTSAPYNWYGTNSPSAEKFLAGNGTLIYSPWLILNINAHPSTINAGESSLITADVYRDSAGGDHSAYASQFFSGPRVTFTTDLGNVGSKSITVPWASGMATATLRADEGPGMARVTASDYQTVQTFVNIGSNGSVETAAAKTLAMQETGIPITGLILAILMVLGGLYRRE